MSHKLCIFCSHREGDIILCVLRERHSDLPVKSSPYMRACPTCYSNFSSRRYGGQFWDYSELDVFDRMDTSDSNVHFILLAKGETISEIIYPKKLKVKENTEE